MVRVEVESRKDNMAARRDRVWRHLAVPPVQIQIVSAQAPLA
jgi:hypothetical protein